MARSLGRSLIRSCHHHSACGRDVGITSIWKPRRARANQNFVVIPANVEAVRSAEYKTDLVAPAEMMEPA